MHLSGRRQRSAFSWWLRTGRVPAEALGDRVEHKFNPWHDPDTGRFTFAGGGRRSGFASPRSPAGLGPVLRTAGAPARDRPASAPIRAALTNSRAAATTRRFGRVPGDADPGSKRLRTPRVSQTSDAARPVGAFVGGAAHGVADTVVGTARSIYSLVTRPVSTAHDMVFGAAGAIDKAIAAEDTPAHVQLSRAARALGRATARDVGHATGTIVAGGALGAVSGAGLSRLSRLAELSRLAKLPERPSFAPPDIVWKSEKLPSGKAWSVYNDGAPGAQPGRAPALTRTMPDGSKRSVKFDGIEGDYVIDRKWRVTGKPRAREQVSRQTQALGENRLTGIWEVPNLAERTKALKLLKKLGANNIKVRVAAP